MRPRSRGARAPACRHPATSPGLSGAAGVALADPRRNSPRSGGELAQHEDGPGLARLRRLDPDRGRRWLRWDLVDQRRTSAGHDRRRGHRQPSALVARRPSDRRCLLGQPYGQTMVRRPYRVVAAGCGPCRTGISSDRRPTRPGRGQAGSRTRLSGWETRHKRFRIAGAGRRSCRDRHSARLYPAPLDRGRSRLLGSLRRWPGRIREIRAHLPLRHRRVTAARFSKYDFCRGWYDQVMTASGFALFDTAIGLCAIAWGNRGVAGVQLPEAGEAETRARMLHRFPAAGEAAPPAEVQRAIQRMAALLRGEASDLSTVALDMDGLPEFHRRVYEAALTIPPGKTLSYGDIARRVGAPGAARAVGQALGRNPFPIVVPCHRVLAAGGKIGGFSAQGGIATKRRMLAIEGAQLDAGAPLLNGAQVFGFDPGLAVAHLRAADTTLAEVIDGIGPFRMRLRPAPSIFAALAESIAYQQLNGKAAAAIFARVCALFPRGLPTAA